MTDAEDSGQEAAEESESAPDESPERSESSYKYASISEDTAYESGEAQRGASYRNTSRKTAAKKTAIMGSLEKAVSESSASEERGNAHYTAIRPVLSLAERAEAAHGNDSDDSADSNESNNTANSAVIIICKRDEKTRELEFLCEQKPLDHPDAGKLSLVGGRIQKGEKSLDALVRELSEELDEPAASIVIKSLDKYSFYQRLPYEYKGVKGYTDIYAVEIRHEASWNAVKQAMFKHDAGFPRVLKQHELHVDDFAFGYGEIVKKFADSKSVSKKITHSPHAGSPYIDSLGSRISNSFNYAGSTHMAQFDSNKSVPFLYSGSIYSAPTLLPSLYSPKSQLAGLQIAA